MATAAPEAAHTAHGALGGPAGARCLGTVSVEPLPASPSWRVRCGCLRDISRTSSAARLFNPHDQIGVRGQRVVQSVAERRQHHDVHVAQLGQGWVGTDRSAARIRSHHHRTESPPGPRPPGHPTPGPRSNAPSPGSPARAGVSTCATSAWTRTTSGCRCASACSTCAGYSHLPHPPRR